MLKFTNKIFSIDPLISQVENLNFEKRLNLNKPTGSFFGDPWDTLPEFIDTPLGSVLQNLGPIGEARLMRLTSAETYTAHGDPDDRYHISIITNPHSYLINLTDGNLHHLPADGKLWLMDTSKIHVAANFGGRDRIHLNVRLLLPKFNSDKNSVRIKIEGGDFDWKQESYIEIMPELNQLIKSHYVTGFDRITDRELLLNVVDRSILDPIVSRLKEKGFEIIVS
jgi:hypothetical protein